MEYDTGAVGMVWSCAVNAGLMHGQKIRIIGEKASLEWCDEHPNQLRYEVQGEPARVLDRGMGYLEPEALDEDRIGPGHAEGLFEAWSNLYRRFAIAMRARERGEKLDIWYPDIRSGVEGVRWIVNCVKSADLDGIWVTYE